MFIIFFEMLECHYALSSVCSFPAFRASREMLLLMKRLPVLQQFMRKGEGVTVFTSRPLLLLLRAAVTPAACVGHIGNLCSAKPVPVNV